VVVKSQTLTQQAFVRRGEKVITPNQLESAEKSSTRAT